MCTAFDSPYAHIPGPASLVQKKRSQRFLASIRYLIKRPSRTYSEVREIGRQASRNPPTSESNHHSWQRSFQSAHLSQERSLEGSSRNQQYRHVPSMTEYLTLAQLEDVWQGQESCRRFAITPQRVSSSETPFPDHRQPTISTERVQSRLPRRRSQASWARSQDFDDSSWSRPPSYQP